MVGTTIEEDAQGRGNGHRGNHKKEYAKKHRKHDKAFHKQEKTYWKYAEKRDREYRTYYEKRDREYRKYAKQRNHRYRAHDDWYYGKRFHHRSEYAYFPRYRSEEHTSELQSLMRTSYAALCLQHKTTPHCEQTNPIP